MEVRTKQKSQDEPKTLEVRNKLIIELGISHNTFLVFLHTLFYCFTYMQVNSLLAANIKLCSPSSHNLLVSQQSFPKGQQSNQISTDSTYPYHTSTRPYISQIEGRLYFICHTCFFFPVEQVWQVSQVLNIQVSHSTVGINQELKDAGQRQTQRAIRTSAVYTP